MAADGDAFRAVAGVFHGRFRQYARSLAAEKEPWPVSISCAITAKEKCGTMIDVGEAALASGECLASSAENAGFLVSGMGCVSPNAEAP